MLIDTNVRQTVRPSRRSVVRGAAWSVPVVSMAATAPAFAASCGSTEVAYRLDWNGGTTATGLTTWSRSNYTAGSASVGAPSGSGGTALAVGFASSWIREGGGPLRDRRDQNLNLTISSEPNVGGLGQGKGLYIRHESPISGERTRRQQIVVTFGRPVRGLQFSITDIDSTFDQYWDRVELTALTPTGTSAAFTPTLSANMSGTGAGSSTAFRQNSSDRTFDADEGGGNVKIAFDSSVSVSSMTIQFWSATAGGQQAIYLSDFTFSAKAC